MDWNKLTDGNGSSVRVVLFDFKKAFDLISTMQFQSQSLPLLIYHIKSLAELLVSYRIVNNVLR